MHYILLIKQIYFCGVEDNKRLKAKFLKWNFSIKE